MIESSKTAAKAEAKADPGASVTSHAGTPRHSVDDTENSNASSRPPNPQQDTPAPDLIDEEDITTQTPQSDTDVPLQDLGPRRSATILSLEERSVGNNASSQEPTAVTPHEQNFYQYRWFLQLIIVISIQLLYLIIVALSIATGTVIFLGIDTSSGLDLVTIALALFSWVTCYAPLTMIFYALPFVVLLAARLQKWKWYAALNQKLNWRVFVGLQLLYPVVLLLLSFNTLARMPLGLIPDIWEEFLPFGWYITIYVAGIGIGVALVWSVVLYFWLN